MSILRCESLTRSYVSGGREITVLRDTTFDLEPGAFLAITGPSGSGKSTLLGLLAGLDRPTRGRVVLDGRDLGALGEDDRARVRAESVGFVFQSFHLIPTLTARENIQVPLELRGEDGRARAEELLGRVGLGDRGHHYPAQLSGGEQQRVAVARAFAHRPKILFADEPTGNLDASNGQNVIALLGELNRELGTTLVLVTHDPDLARLAHRVIRLRDGAVVEDTAVEPALLMSRPVDGNRLRVPFILSLAWRESRGSRRRGLLIVMAVAIGTAALVSINSFADNVRESVAREARALLGADIAISSPSPFSPASEALLEELRRATDPPAEVARVVSFGAMALRPGGGSTRLVRVQAVDPGYPFYGPAETAPAGEWRRLAETGGAVVDASLLDALGARVGDEIALGEARFVLRATLDNVPGDVGFGSALGPRVLIPRARVSETSLLTRGSRARYEAFLRLPPGTDAQRIAERFRSRLSAERLNVRTVSDDQRGLTQTLSRFGNFLGLVALVALLLGGLGVASAVHVLIRRRMATVAVLRCLGATGGTVLAAYLVQAALVGLLGGLVGALLGTAAQVAIRHLLRPVLPVDVAWSVSWPSVLGGIGVGVWVSFLFSLLPLLAVRHVSPLAVLRRDYEEALVPRRDLARSAAAFALAASLVALAVLQAGRTSFGLGFAAGVGVAVFALWLCAWLLVRGLRRFLPRRLPYLYRQGLANLYRPANQTLMVVLTLGFGAFLLSTLLLVQHNLLGDLRVDRGARARTSCSSTFSPISGTTSFAS